MDGGAPSFPPPAASNETAPGVHEHDGFYFRLGLGFGALIGSAESTANASGGKETADLSGFALLPELAIGGTVAPGLVIGGASLPILVPSLGLTGHAAGMSADFTTSMVATMVGPFVDYYLDPSGGFHVQGSIGLATVAIPQSSPTHINGIGDLRRPAQDEAGLGVGLMLGVGKEWWIGDQWSMGVLGRLHWIPSVSLSDADGNDTGSGSGVVPALAITATYH